MTERDANGMRMVDGKPFSILLEHGAHAPDLEPVAELVAEQLKAVGIDLQVKRIDPTLWGQRHDANELQATMFWSHDAGWGQWLWQRRIHSSWARWELWHTTENAEGEESPQWVR